MTSNSSPFGEVVACICAAEVAQEGDVPMAACFPPGLPLHQFSTAGASLRSVGTERRTEHGAQEGDVPIAGCISQGPPLHQFGTPGASLRSVGTERRTEQPGSGSQPRTTFDLDFFSTCAQDDPARVYASQSTGYTQSMRHKYEPASEPLHISVPGVQAPGSMCGVVPEPDR